jgi:hypothetical protein
MWKKIKSWIFQNVVSKCKFSGTNISHRKSLRIERVMLFVIDRLQTVLYDTRLYSCTEKCLEKTKSSRTNICLIATLGIKNAMRLKRTSVRKAQSYFDLCLPTHCRCRGSVPHAHTHVHAHTRFIGRTPLDEWSVRRRELSLTTFTTDIRDPGGIRTRNPSRRAAADRRLRLESAQPYNVK